MGILDWFRGRPTEDQFARLMMKTLRDVGDERTPTYDKAEFRLTFSASGDGAETLNLRNLYIEYSNAPRTERATLLRRSCVGLARKIEPPDDFEDARPDLLPTVRSKAMFEVMRLEAEIEGSAWRDMPALPLSEHLVSCIIYDLPTTMQFVSQDLLDKWGVSLYEASEIARQNLEQREFAVGKVGDHLFVFVTNDAFDAARMLLLDAIRGLPLNGDPVALPLNRDSLMLTGADDVEGLGLIADLAQKKKDEARPICPIPHRLVGDEWEAWLPPADHPHYEAFRMLELGYLYGAYAEQKPLLEKRFEKRGEAVFAASYSVVERNGKLLSYSVWTKGVPAWLPKTEYVGLYDPERKQTWFVPWAKLHQLGDRLLPLDDYPPRWFVDDFPAAEEIESLGPENWNE